MWQVDCRGKGMTRARARPRSVRRMRASITARSRPGEGRWCVNGGRGRYPCCGIGKRTGEFRWAGKRHPVGRRRVLINQSGETLGLTVRFAPNSGAKADILGPPLRANERTRLRGSALRAGRSSRQRRRAQLR